MTSRKQSGSGARRGTRPSYSVCDTIQQLRGALERIIDADTVVSDGGKVHDHGQCAEIAIEALSLSQAQEKT